METFQKLPSYELVILLKQCKEIQKLLPAKNSYHEKIKATILCLKSILIERQVI